MEFRQLGGSGFKVPVLSLGTGTFGGGNEFFKSWGASDVAEATRLVDVCLEAGLTMFDSADVYSNGKAEEILGQAIKGRRHQVLISTKGTFRTGSGPNDLGSSRFHITEAVEASLRRLGTDHIDLYQLHGFDARTPMEEVLATLDNLVRAGKIRYIGCSNFSGWHLMKSLAISEKYGLARYVAHQAYYSLVGRDYEWELMPLALDQKIGTVIWSPLGWGKLTGKLRRGQALPETTRLAKQALQRQRPAGFERARLQGGGCAGRRGKRNRQDHTADCAQLAAATPVGRHNHCRRPKRGAIAPEPRCSGLEPGPGANRETRCRQRDDAGLSVLAPARHPGTQSAARLKWQAHDRTKSVHRKDAKTQRRKGREGKA